MDTLFKCITGVFSIHFVSEKFNNIFAFNDNEKALRGNIENLTTRSSDIKTDVLSAERLGNKRRKKEVGKWLVDVETFKQECDGFDDTLKEAGHFKALRYGNRVKKLIGYAEKLINRSHNFGELALDAPATSKERLFTTKLHGEASKRKLENIVELLRAGSNIGIYGMGGVGKTTLARHVYTNLRDAPDGFYVCWVTVSQEADNNKLQHDLARELDCNLSKDDDSAAKAAKLYRSLTVEQVPPTR